MPDAKFRYDAVFHILFYVMMVMRLNTESSFGRLNFDPTVRIYYDFANVMYWDEVANGMASVIAWMLWFRWASHRPPPCSQVVLILCIARHNHFA
jgi:hypothetical protein